MATRKTISTDTAPATEPRARPDARPAGVTPRGSGRPAAPALDPRLDAAILPDAVRAAALRKSHRDDQDDKAAPHEDAAGDGQGQATDGDAAAGDPGSGAERVEVAMLSEGDLAAAAAGAPAEGAAAGAAPASASGGGGGGATLLYALGGIAIVGAGVALAGGGSKAAATPVTPPDTTPPAAPTGTLANDTGASATDRVTRDGTITVGGLESGGRWEYSTNGGSSWTAGSGTSFVLPAGTYANLAVQIRQFDAAGNGASVSLPGLTVDGTAPVAPSIDRVAGDDVVGSDERSKGVSVTGSAEAGSSVAVSWGAVTVRTTAAADGSWKADFKAEDVPAALGASTVSVQATDLAGNVSPAATRAVTRVASLDVSGQVVAGPVVAGNGLTIDLYGGDGSVLARGLALGKDGSFSTRLDLSDGTVVVARVVDGNAAADYLDEATGAAKDLDAVLLAIGVARAGGVVLNVNPLTTLAAREAGLAADGTGTVTAAAASAASAAVAGALGLPGLDLVATKVVATNGGSYDPADGLGDGEKLGLLLAAVSAADVSTGSTAATLTALLDALTVTGATGTLSDAGAALLLAGAAAAEAAIPGAFQTGLSDLLATGASASRLSIDAVATDNIVNAVERAGLTVTGKVAAGADKVTLAIGDARIDATVADGVWTAALTADAIAALAGDGAKSLVATASFSDGGSATARRAVIVDATAPAVPAIDAVGTLDRIGAAQKAAGVAVTGTAEAGTRVDLDWAGAKASVTAGSDGTWRATFAADRVPADGARALSAVAVDPNGNASPAATRSITVDTAAPKAPVIDAVAKNDLVGALEAKDGVTVSGTAEPGATVDLVWGSARGRQTVGSDGKWSLVVAAADVPADGATTVAVTQTDLAGNTGPAGERAVRVAAKLTAPFIFSVDTDNVVNLAEATAGFTIVGMAPANSALLVEWQGVSWPVAADANGDWSLPLGIAELPADGEAVLTVTAFDANGVATGSDSRTVTLDTTAPAPVGLGEVGAAGVINAAAKAAGVTVSGTGDAGARIELAWAGLTRTAVVGDDGNWSVSIAADQVPADGATDLSVRQRDAAGNPSVTTTAKVRIDTGIPLAPTVALKLDAGSSATDGLTNNNVIAVSGLDSDTLWDYSTDGGENWQRGTGSSFEVPEDSYPVGSLRVRQTDAAGNVSAEGGNLRAFVIDRTPPDPSIGDVTSDNYVNAAERAAGVTVTGTAEARSRVTVRWGSETLAVDADGNGAWSAFFPTARLPKDGESAVTVSAVDLAGNASPTPISLPVIIDTVAPPTPSVALTADTGRSTTDRITSDGRIQIRGLQSDTIWEYSLDAGKTWSEGSDAELDLVAGDYANGQVLVRQTDAARNASATVDLGGRLVVDTNAAVPVLLPVATDGIVNARERAAGVTLNGQAEAQAIVKADWAGVVKTATANANGEWSITFQAAELPGDGSWPVKLSQTDLAGNVSVEATTDVVVNTVAPGLPTIAQVTADGAVNAAEEAAGVTVEGTAGANATVRLSWGSATATTTADAAGKWSVLFDAKAIPADGNTTIEAVQENSIGNISDAAKLPVLVDTVTAAPTVDPVAGDGAVNRAERAAGVTLTGKAEADSRVTVTWGSTTVSTTADAAGTWTAAFSSTQVPSDGNAAVQVKVVDRYDNSNQATSSPVRIDSLAPAVPTISAVSSDNIITAAERALGIVVQGTAEARATVLLGWGDQVVPVTVGDNGVWRTTLTADQLPTTGDVRFTAVAVDAANNESLAASRLVVATSAAAGVPVIAPVTGDDYVSAADRDAGVRVSGIGPANGAVTVAWGSASKSVTAGANGVWTASFEKALVPTDGSYDIVATSGGISSQRSIVVDTTRPAAVVIDAVTGDNRVTATEIAAGVTVTGAGEAGALVSLTWDGAPAKTATVGADGVWSIRFDPFEIPQGSNILTAVQTDLAGNASDAAKLTVETIAAAATSQALPQLALEYVAAPPIAAVPGLGSSTPNTTSTDPGASIWTGLTTTQLVI